jgi:hypothetical protein
MRTSHSEVHGSAAPDALHLQNMVETEGQGLLPKAVFAPAAQFIDSMADGTNMNEQQEQ